MFFVLALDHWNLLNIRTQFILVGRDFDEPFLRGCGCGLIGVSCVNRVSSVCCGLDQKDAENIIPTRDCPPFIL